MRKKHILIDARLYGPKHTGIGRYTKNLLKNLINQTDFEKYTFSLLIYPELKKEIETDLGNKFNLISTNIKHYSLKEQLLLPFIINKINPDLVHFLHFNKPIFYFGKSVITVHDLIKHFFKGKETTTKNSALYWVKYYLYLAVTYLNIKLNTIIVPSNYWKNYITKNFNISPSKITTTYEAVDSEFIKIALPQIDKPQKYIIYTGNLYPHKNIDVVLSALKKLPQIKLKIISARSFFTQKLQDKIKHFKIEKQVEILGYLPDQEFASVYQKAIALVHPSLMEGFSLTGLEAMALNCPVISSNASCLPEIYGDSVLYFDPLNSSQLIDRINELTQSTKLRSDLIHRGNNQIKKYSWNKTAKETIQVYSNLLA